MKLRNLVATLALLVTPLFAQDKKPVPPTAPVVHKMTYEELSAENAALKTANKQLYDQLLASQLALSDEKVKQLQEQDAQLSSERRFVTDAIVKENPGMLWDDRTHQLVPIPKPAVAAKPAPTESPAPKPSPAK